MEKKQKNTETQGHLMLELACRHLFASQPNFQNLLPQPLLQRQFLHPFEQKHCRLSLFALPAWLLTCGGLRQTNARPGRTWFCGV
jgi:hypothetical protein